MNGNRFEKESVGCGLSTTNNNNGKKTLGRTAKYSLETLIGYRMHMPSTKERPTRALRVPRRMEE